VRNARQRLLALRPRHDPLFRPYRFRCGLQGPRAGRVGWLRRGGDMTTRWFILSAIGRSASLVSELAQLVLDSDANLEDSRMWSSAPTSR
jgi:hypothetical protein